MRKTIVIVICLVLLVGCIGQRKNNQDDLVTATPVFTKQATLTDIALSATFTPARSTRTPNLTPSPTSTQISTPTSDFQNVKQVIFTPASPEICPPDATSEVAIPTAGPWDDSTFATKVIAALNGGGAKQLVRHLSEMPGFHDGRLRYEDLTNDSVRELIVYDLPHNIGVYGCQNGKYINLLSVNSDVIALGPNIVAIRDMNHNGIKELVVEVDTCHACTGIKVYEWNGKNFESLIRYWYMDYHSGKLDYLDIVDVGGVSDASIADIDNNGTYELIVRGGAPSYSSGRIGVEGPWRLVIEIYMWDGQYFVWYSQKYDAPNFRFEAIQDGDAETIRGDYDSALKSYQAAIFDDKLKSWTQEVWRDLSQNQNSQILSYPDIEKMPFNQVEYDQLSAYARYRIMIIYLKQGWDSDARTVYEDLIEKYPQGTPGYPYTELATYFWDKFQASSDLNLSCTEAINYATNHPEILEPLGRHGLFDAFYEPEDICPFR